MEERPKQRRLERQPWVLLGALLAGIAAGVFYAPIDNVFAVSRVLRTLRPSLVVILETEIWPNLFREAKRAGCGLVIVNGRISDRTERRYRKQKTLKIKYMHILRKILNWT